MLDITPLRNAAASLERSLGVFKREVPYDAATLDTLRSGVIQNFEVAFELSWKFMKRWLAANRDPTAIAGTPMKELFRYAAENQLIGSVEPWFAFLESRNITSHTYNEDSAEKAALLAEAFLPIVQDFVSRLAQRI